MRQSHATKRPVSRRASIGRTRPTAEEMERRLLLAAYTVTSTADDPTGTIQGSLRSVINLSNSNPGPNTIAFNLGASGAQTINLTVALPALTTPVTIDGSRLGGTQPTVVINGSGITGGADGLDVLAGNSTIRALAIVGFTGEGIALSAKGGNTVTFCSIGFNPATLASAPNGIDGIVVGSGADNSTIISNLIVGNGAYGVRVDGTYAGSNATTVAGTQVSGNAIGVNTFFNGGIAAANRYGGVLIQNAPNTNIGGSGGNVISGNTNTVNGTTVTGTGDGIDVNGGSAGTVIAGNAIGTTATGSAAIANTGAGIALNTADSITIGPGNIISGNTTYGIVGSVTAAAVVVIRGNTIGTTAGGTQALPNGSGGINITGNATTTIGGTSSAAANVVSGNRGAGITVAGTGTKVQGNYVGTGAGGSGSLGNAGAGIVATSSGILIGGIATGSGVTFGNTVANNAGGGVIANAANVPITFNSITGNSGLGITNTFSTPTPPVVATAVGQGATATITGSITEPAGTYLVQFFANAGGTIPGNPQGATYLGQTTITSTGVRATYTATVNGFALPGYVTATATLLNGTAPNVTLGATSQFSNAVRATGKGPANLNPVLSVAAVPATVNAGDNITYTFRIANTSSVTDSGIVFFNPIPGGATFFSGSTSLGGVPVVLTNGVAVAQIGTLAPGASATVTIILTAGAVPSITNSAYLTADTPTVAVGDDTITTPTTTVTPAADLAVSVIQVAGPTDSTVTTGTPVPVGQNITYLVSVSNFGPSTATNVKLTDLLPSGTTFVSATTDSANPADAPTNTGSQVAATIASLASGAIVTYTITVGTNGGTPASVVATATVAGDQVDPDTSTNTGSATTTVVPSSDLAITSEVASAGAVQAGTAVTFTINVVNNGLSPATGVKIADVLPGGLTFVSGSAPGGAVTVDGNGVVTAPIGDLAVGGTGTVTITVLTGAAGTFSDAATASSDNNDPNTGNNSSSASVTVSALINLGVTLSGPATLNTGNPLVYTATVTNAGPSPASNVLFSLPLFVGANFQSATIDGVAVGSVDNGTLTANLGTIAANGAVTLVITVIPTQAGTVTSTATVTAAEPDAAGGTVSSSPVDTVLSVPRPIIAFAQALYTVDETAGTATITLDRIGDTSGVLTVRFTTVPGGNATPGLDYTPVDTTLTFPAGVSQITATVPVLANPFDRLDEYVGLQLSNPTDATFLNDATVAPAVLRIVNLDPVTVGPKVTDLKLFGPRNAITGIEVSTSGNLDPATATNVANYTLLALGGGGKNGLPYGTAVAVAQAVYNPATGAVLLIPSRPLPANELFMVVINGTTATAVTDRAGNPLNSVLGATAGSNYVLTVARGTNLSYTDENGKRVNLKLTGPGTLDIDRAVTGQVGRLQILGGVARKTSITGTVSPRASRTNIGAILGLDRFGTFITKLYSPPFFLNNAAFPNPANLVNTPAVDVLIGSATATTGTGTGTAGTGKVASKAVAGNKLVPVATAVPHPTATSLVAARKRAGR